MGSEVKGDQFFSKWMTFMGMYFGYTLAIINRRSFSFALPAIMNNLNLDKNELGLISTSQTLAYTISKFCSGILCDKFNAKYLFTFGLFISGILTISLSAFRSAGAFAFILFLQGLSQGGCWPACAKILKGMYSSSEFGTRYGLLNTAMNVACCIGPIMVAFIVTYHAWSSVFVFSGIAAILGSLLSYRMIEWPVPQDLNCDVAASTQPQGRGTWVDLLKSPLMWVVCISYFVVYGSRQAALDWGQLYLIQELKHSQHIGSLFISCMEVGGVVGSIISGYLADKMVAKCQNSLNGSPRMMVAMFFVAIFAVSMHLFLFFMSAGSTDLFIMLVGFFMGFGVYGPISIYGVMSIEASPVHLQGTSHAIVSLAANLGAAAAGLPFSLVAEKLNWRGAFVILELMLVAAVAMKFLTRNLKYKMVDTKKKIQ